MRTPQRIIHKAQNFFDDNQIIIQNIDKKAYLSSLKLANHVIVTCDSTSMISDGGASSGIDCSETPKQVKKKELGPYSS